MENKKFQDILAFCHELEQCILKAQQRGRDALYQLMAEGKLPTSGAAKRLFILFDIPKEDWPEHLQEVQEGNKAPELSEFYTTKEATSKLGFKDISSLSRLCTSGKIPNATKIGHSWFIPKSWVHEQERVSPNPKGNRGVARNR